MDLLPRYQRRLREDASPAIACPTQPTIFTIRRASGASTTSSIHIESITSLYLQGRHRKISHLFSAKRLFLGSGVPRSDIHKLLRPAATLI